MDEPAYPDTGPPEMMFRVLLAIVDKLDHIHDDLVTLRDVAGRPRPECYTLPADLDDSAESRRPGRERSGE